MKKIDIAVVIAIVAYFAIFLGILEIGHHYIMVVYYWINGPMSEVYPHYYTEIEAAVIAAIGGVLIGAIVYYIMSLEKIFRGMGAKNKSPQSGMSQ